MAALNDETFTSVVVSLAHLPEALAEYMQSFDTKAPYNPEDEHIDLVFERIDFGFRLFTECEYLPEPIKPIMGEAYELGHKWVEFDCDGEQIDGFETWEW